MRAHRTVLDEIVDRVRTRLAVDKIQHPVENLKSMIADAPPVRPFADALRTQFGLIAEIKRCSPSQGSMRHQNISETTCAYQKSNVVRALSVLTNRDDFGMSVDDLKVIRPLSEKPILRKDFIVDEYQIYEARAFGADAILLMTNVITDLSQMKRLFELCQNLGMDALFECRSKEEIDSVPSGARIYGINSRKLKAKKILGVSRYTLARLTRYLGGPDSSIQLESFELARHIPSFAVKVAESGVGPNDIAAVRGKYHYNAALVGTAILNAPTEIEATLELFSRALLTVDSDRVAETDGHPAIA